MKNIDSLSPRTKTVRLDGSHGFTVGDTAVLVQAGPDGRYELRARNTMSNSHGFVSLHMWGHGERRISAIRTLKNGETAITVGPDIAPYEL